jgi:putative ABC transport system permease protein
MDILRQDLTFAVRTLLANRLATSIAILCIAIGIGVNTATFSMVDSILFAPLPFRDPARVVGVFGVQPRLGVRHGALSHPDLADIRARNRTLDGLAMFAQDAFSVADSGRDADHIVGAEVSANLFRVLGVSPVVGHDFLDGNDLPGGDGVVLLSHELWSDRYQADPGIVGRTITVNGVPRTVLGVMPAGFAFPFVQKMWVPFGVNPATAPRGDRIGVGVARLKAGVSLTEADADVRAIASRIAETFPAVNAGRGASVAPFRDYLSDEYTRMLAALVEGAVAFVLLIACANVANLSLTRALAREREIAVRSALGASRLRIVRQLLTENLVTAVAGGLLGLLLATWGMEAMRALIPVELPFWIRLEINGRVLAFTTAATLLSGLAFGLVPALQLSSASGEALKDGTRGSSSGARGRIRNGFVVTQLGLSLVLLIVATLMVRGFLSLQQRDVGYAPAPLLAAQLVIRAQGRDSIPQRLSYARRITERLAATPEVVSAALVDPLPLSGNGNSVRVVVDGHPVPRGDEPSVSSLSVTDRFFDTYALRPLSGRVFDPRGRDDSLPVAVVSERFARQYWPPSGRDAIGGRFRLGLDSAGGWLTIVGVVPTIRMDMVDAPDAQVYLPYGLAPRAQMALVARVAPGVDPHALAPALRSAARAVDPLVPVFDVYSVPDVISRRIWGFRFVGQLLGAFAALAFVLAAIGVYGVIAFSVAQRTREVGVRIALGARPADVLRLVMRQGVWLVCAGLAVGVAGAGALSRLMTLVLFGVSPADAVAFVAIPLALAAVALFASWVPARRATLVNPVEALRHE